jgi:N-6 DNA Methylase/Domain of unknown function (DUF4145)
VWIDFGRLLLSVPRTALPAITSEFRDPRHIIALIVALVNPRAGLRICDPACGTAGFLIAAFNHILRENTSNASLKKGVADGDLLKPAQWKFLEEHAFTGYDNDANMVKIDILNLYLHQLEKANIEFHNPLTEGKGSPYPGLTYDVILANPPFSGAIQKESILADINLPTRDTEKLFLKWFIDHLVPGGMAGVIVPTGILFGSDKASRKQRAPLKKCYAFPKAVRRLYLETLKAFSNEAPTLAAVGIRSVVEATCLDQGIKKGNLERKIDALVIAGILTPVQANLLHLHRYLGNLAVHESEMPAAEELEAALEIIEILLTTVYILPKTAVKMKRSQAEAASKQKAKSPSSPAKP